MSKAVQRVVRVGEAVADLEELVMLATTDSEQRGLDSTISATVTALMELELEAMFTGDHDHRPAVCRLQAGQGGVEANDWTGMLLRMYARWASLHGLHMEITSSAKGSEAGYSSAEFVVVGDHAYGWMRSEHGVHRLARVSPHGNEGKVHTSFSALQVSPLLDEMAKTPRLMESDVRVDTYRGSGPGGQHRNVTDSAVRLTHRPTGLVVRCENERSQRRNKDEAMRLLTSKLAALEAESIQRAIDARRAGQPTAGFGSQARSYTLHPYKMVKDHRTGFKTHDADGVLNGEIRPLMEALLRRPDARQDPDKQHPARSRSANWQSGQR